MFSPGEPVLCRCRKLWHGAVMTAMPMRVVADAPDRTVLYQAPDTAFRGARTPKGTKIRDFSAEWASMDLVWAGGSLIRLIEPAEQMISVVESGGPPYNETHWLSWRPPPHWTVPALPASWAACRFSYPSSGE